MAIHLLTMGDEKQMEHLLMTPTFISRYLSEQVPHCGTTVNKCHAFTIVEKRNKQPRFIIFLYFACLLLTITPPFITYYIQSY